MEQKGFIPKIVGGFGNQAFIAVGSWIAAKVHGCPSYFPVQNTSKNPHSKVDYTQTILKEFGTHIHISEEEAYTKAGHTLWHNKGFAHWSPSLIQPGLVLDSYFQYYPPFAPFEDEIRSKMLNNLPNVKSMPEAAFLHIRRGDYIQLAHYLFVQDMNYYTKALNELSKRGAFERLYILSNDLVWAKQQRWPVDSYVQIEYVDKDEVESLALMASCHAGAIIGNSTFSWWGAFLGAYSQRSPVIAPSRWVAEHVDCLFPPEWIVV